MATIDESSRATAREDVPWTQRFVELAAPYLQVMVVALSILVVFALFNAFAIWLLGGSSAGGVVATLALALDVVGIALIAPLIYACRRHEQKKIEQEKGSEWGLEDRE